MGRTGQSFGLEEISRRLKVGPIEVAKLPLEGLLLRFREWLIN